MFPLERHTIFLTLAGSQAHGTARDGSDVDLRGVCIAPLSSRLSLFKKFEQYEGGLPDFLAQTVIPRIEGHPTASRALAVKTECVVFDVAKFVGLCAAANPTALEILFADERDWVFETPVWRVLHHERHRFLTKKVQQTFHGYAMTQLKKIHTHRWRISNPSTSAPYRNPLRAELERQHGYDTKHAMHLIRVMRMGVEALESGDLRVRRDDAEELTAIRDGALSFDELLAAAAGLQGAMQHAAATTSLPTDVDREGVDELLWMLLREYSQ